MLITFGYLLVLLQSKKLKSMYEFSAKRDCITLVLIKNNIIFK